MRNWFLIFYCAWSYADLGLISVSSYLGQPLNAIIPISNLASTEYNNLNIGLASGSKFKEYGLVFTPELASLVFKLGLKGQRHYLQLTSVQPLTAPVVSFLLHYSLNNNDYYREYTLLLDPPGYAPEVALTRADSTLASIPLVDPREKHQSAAAKPALTSRQRLSLLRAMAHKFNPKIVVESPELFAALPPAAHAASGFHPSSAPLDSSSTMLVRSSAPLVRSAVAPDGSKLMLGFSSWWRWMCTVLLAVLCAGFLMRRRRLKSSVAVAVVDDQLNAADGYNFSVWPVPAVGSRELEDGDEVIPLLEQVLAEDPDRDDIGLKLFELYLGAQRLAQAQAMYRLLERSRDAKLRVNLRELCSKYAFEADLIDPNPQP